VCVCVRFLKVKAQKVGSNREEELVWAIFIMFL